MIVAAYHFSFTTTGREAIDKILAAIADAGKAHHHTEDWSEADGTGLSCADRIQQAARLAAAEINLITAMHRDMCRVNGGLVSEMDRLRSALNDIASGCACLPGYSAADAAATARQALAPPVEP